MISPFSHPEILELDTKLENSLFNESGRGALLIVTAHVEKFLTDLIKEAMPSDFSNNSIKKLLLYPGPLANFGAKIELAFAFRLISKNLYTSLNSLRRIRNDAAHKEAEFSLLDLNDKMMEIYDLGAGVNAFLKQISTEVLLKQKIVSIDHMLIEEGLNENERKKLISELFNDPKRMEPVMQQLPFWEMRIGICLLCFLLVHQKEKLKLLTKDIFLWTDLKKDLPIL